jgi:AcrR family transcriptional regulator
VRGVDLARRDTRALVLSSAKSVFARKGYRGTTVSDILKDAGIARATFYKHFSNKRQVLFEIITGVFRALYEAVGDMLSVQDADLLVPNLRASLALSYRLFLHNRNVIRVYFQEPYRSDPTFYAIWDDFERRMLALFTEFLNRGVSDGIFRPVDTGLVSRAMFLVFLQVPYSDVLFGGMVEIDIDNLADEMVGFVLNGLSGART